MNDGALPPSVVGGDAFPFGPHVHVRPTTAEGVDRVRVIVRVQLRAFRRREDVGCASCGREMAYTVLFRCFHCGVFICRRCGEAHFGPRP